MRRAAFIASGGALVVAMVWMIASARRSAPSGAKPDRTTPSRVANDLPPTVATESDDGGEPDDFYAGLRGRPLFGDVVLRATGEPVADVVVTLSSPWSSVDAFTDAAGAFELPNVRAGTYELRARKGNLAGLLYEVEISDGERAPLRIELDPAFVVSGRVTASSGLPLAGVPVAAMVKQEHFWSWRDPRTVARAVTAVDGRFKLDGMFPGDYAITAQPKTRYANAAEDATVVDRDVEGVELALREFAAIAGRVVDASGHGVEGAELAVHAAGKPWPELASTRSRANGEFELARLAPGDALVVRAEHPTGRATSEPLNVGGGERHELTLTLAEGASISGTVTFADGRPAEGLLVSDFGSRHQSTTDRNGHYRLLGLDAGLCQLMVRRSGDSMLDTLTSEFVQLKPNQRRNGIDLKIAGGHRLAGHVLFPDGKPAPGISIDIVWVSDRFGSRSARTNEDGSFTVEDLPGETFRVRAHGDEGFASVEKEDVPADTLALELRLRRFGALAGRVVDRSGAPVVDYTLFVVPLERMWDRRQLSLHDPNGAFRVSKLEPDSYDLTARTSDGCTALLSQVRADDGQERGGLVLTLAAAATVRGRVVDHSGGAPVAGAHVSVYQAGRSLKGDSDASGSFAIAGLAAGAITVSVDAPSGYLNDSGHRAHFPDGAGDLDIGAIRLMRGAWPDEITAFDGLEAENVDGTTRVGSVQPGSPADRAGIRAGDALLSVNDQDCSDLGREAVNFLLLGGPDTPITIEFAPAAGGPAHTVTIHLAPVSSH